MGWLAVNGGTAGPVFFQPGHELQGVSQPHE